MFDYETVFEEENFIIVNKKSGLLVHKNKYEQNNTLIDLVNKNKSKTLYLINRIDRDTSGLLFIAKNKLAVIKFQELFKNQQVHKEYLAITPTCLQAKTIKIDLSLGKSKTNKLMFSAWNGTNYKPSTTYAHKIDNNLIRVSIVTGRTHQIRAHLFAIKRPILNDPIYGKTLENDDFGQYLHSYQLTFINPFSKQKMSVSTPPPQQFLNKLNEMGISYPYPMENVVEIDDEAVAVEEYVDHECECEHPHCEEEDIESESPYISMSVSKHQELETSTHMHDEADIESPYDNAVDIAEEEKPTKAE